MQKALKTAAGLILRLSCGGRAVIIFRGDLLISYNTLRVRLTTSGELLPMCAPFNQNRTESFPNSECSLTSRPARPFGPESICSATMYVVITNQFVKVHC